MFEFLFGPPNIKKLKAKNDINLLIKALNYPKSKKYDDFDKRKAVEALGQAGNKKAVDPLINALDNPSLRSTAIKALGTIGDQKAVEPILRYTRDSDSDVRRAVANALDALGWKPSDDHSRFEYLWAKGKLDELVKLGEVAVYPLLEILEQGEVFQHIEAAKALGKIGNEKAAEPLIKLLGKVDFYTRNTFELELDRVVKEALLDIGKPAVPFLVDVLQHSTAWPIRCKIAQIFRVAGKLRDTRSVKPLIGALSDDHPAVRQAAATALGSIKDATSVEPLIEAVKDSDDKVRQNAVQALAEIADPRGIDVLTQALGNLNFSGYTLWTVAGVLGTMRDVRGVEPLIKALLIDKRQFQQKVAEALGEIADVRAVQPLIAALRLHIEKEHGVKIKYYIKEAEDALVKIGEPAIDPLIQALEHEEDEHIIKGAIRVLGRIGDERAIRPIEQALEHHRNLKYDSEVALKSIEDRLKN